MEAPDVASRAFERLPQIVPHPRGGTFDLVSGLAKNEDFRKNPRRVWYHNVKEITVNGDAEVSFQLNAPQPSFLALLASGYSPVYPCHVAQRDMRTKPVGTGPFKYDKFVPGGMVELDTGNARYLIRFTQTLERQAGWAWAMFSAVRKLGP